MRWAAVGFSWRMYSTMRERSSAASGDQRINIYERNICSMRAPTSSCVRNSPRSSWSRPFLTRSRNHASWSRYRSTSCCTYSSAPLLFSAATRSSLACNSGVKFTSIALRVGQSKVESQESKASQELNVEISQHAESGVRPFQLLTFDLQLLE